MTELFRFNHCVFAECRSSTPCNRERLGRFFGEPGGSMTRSLKDLRSLTLPARQDAVALESRRGNSENNPALQPILIRRGAANDRRRAEGSQNGRIPRRHDARRSRGTDPRAGTACLSRSARVRQRNQRRAIRPSTAPRSWPTARGVWTKSDLIVKVKEPMPEEWPMMREGQVVFTYFHFAANEELTAAVMKSGSSPSPMRRSRTAKARCRC